MFWEDDTTPPIRIRPPLSTKTHATKIHRSPKTRSRVLSVFPFTDIFFALAIVSRPDEDDIPVVVLLCDENTGEELPTLAEFPEPIRNDDAFAFLFGKGDFETCVGHEVGLRRRYHELVEVGDSIEIGKNESSTAGLFVAGADADQPVLGIVGGTLAT
jgi:hypothetical protein